MADSTRHFTAKEIKDLLWEDREVARIEGASGRWSRSIHSIFETEDGRHWRVRWDEGLTEMQENEYREGDYPEVFATRTLHVERRTEWLTDEERSDLPAPTPALAEALGDLPGSMSVRLDAEGRMA